MYPFHLSVCFLVCLSVPPEKCISFPPCLSSSSFRLADASPSSNLASLSPSLLRCAFVAHSPAHFFFSLTPTTNTRAPCICLFAASLAVHLACLSPVYSSSSSRGGSPLVFRHLRVTPTPTPTTHTFTLPPRPTVRQPPDIHVKIFFTC